MIVDSSVLIAIINDEPEADEFARLLVERHARMSLATWLESSIVADMLSPEHRDALDETIAEAKIELVPVSYGQVRVARDAHRRYGRRSRSKAKLNFGDCFAYALAATEQDELLFKGKDFSETDIIPAI